MRSSENAKAWKGLPADEDFLEAFSVAMVSASVPLPSGDVISIPEEQRLLFQTAGAAVLGADGDAQGAAADAVGALHPESSGGSQATPSARHHMNNMNMHSSVFGGSWSELQSIFNSGRWSEMQGLLTTLFQGEHGPGGPQKTPRSRAASGTSNTSL